MVNGFLLSFVAALFLLRATAYPNVTTSDTTNWEDEKEMRWRMSQYSKEKFSHDYHVWNSPQMKETNRVSGLRKQGDTKTRWRRDGGILSGPVATAVVTGMIGMTARAVTDLVNFQVQMSQGGCSWFGTAPLCNYPCPAEYDYIRASNGRCSNWWAAGSCVPDESFGKPCSTVLGGYFYKRFCCKSDPAECTWSGRWMGANTAHNIYCRYDNGNGRCGTLDCSINHFSFKGRNSSEISGDRCDELNMFGLRGKATCGYIAWYDSAGEVVNSWYKTRYERSIRLPSDSSFQALELQAIMSPSKLPSPGAPVPGPAADSMPPAARLLPALVPPAFVPPPAPNGLVPQVPAPLPALVPLPPPAPVGLVPLVPAPLSASVPPPPSASQALAPLPPVAPSSPPRPPLPGPSAPPPLLPFLAGLPPPPPIEEMEDIPWITPKMRASLRATRDERIRSLIRDYNQTYVGGGATVAALFPKHAPEDLANFVKPVLVPVPDDHPIGWDLPLEQRPHMVFQRQLIEAAPHVLKEMIRCHGMPSTPVIFDKATGQLRRHIIPPPSTAALKPIVEEDPEDALATCVSDVSLVSMDRGISVDNDEMLSTPDTVASSVPIALPALALKRRSPMPSGSPSPKAARLAPPSTAIEQIVEEEISEDPVEALATCLSEMSLSSTPRSHSIDRDDDLKTCVSASSIVITARTISIDPDEMLSTPVSASSFSTVDSTRAVKRPSSECPGGPSPKAARLSLPSSTAAVDPVVEAELLREGSEVPLPEDPEDLLQTCISDISLVDPDDALATCVSEISLVSTARSIPCDPDDALVTCVSDTSIVAVSVPAPVAPVIRRPRAPRLAPRPLPPRARIPREAKSIANDLIKDIAEDEADDAKAYAMFSLGRLRRSARRKDGASINSCLSLASSVARGDIAISHAAKAITALITDSNRRVAAGGARYERIEEDEKKGAKAKALLAKAKAFFQETAE